MAHTRKDTCLTLSSLLTVFKLRSWSQGVLGWLSGWDSRLLLPWPGFNPWSGNRDLKKKKKKVSSNILQRWQMSLFSCFSKYHCDLQVWTYITIFIHCSYYTYWCSKRPIFGQWESLHIVFLTPFWQVPLSLWQFLSHLDGKLFMLILHISCLRPGSALSPQSTSS